MTTLAETPLHPWHVAHGGRMVDFGGWSMPVQFTSIVAEHLATRQAVGLFDISHMGRIRFDGPAAATFLDGLVTRRVDNLRLGRIRYGLMTNDQGGVKDDVLVYHLEDDDGPYHLMVVNASNRQKILAWIDKHIADAADVRYRDLTDTTAMLAVQGPRALELTASLLDSDPNTLRYYTGRTERIGQTTGIVSRTGYTGEDGCELIVPADKSLALWEQLVANGEPLGAQPVGLGARDTLRLEAAMPLYGHELDEVITPLQAGLDFAVDLEGRSFPGSEVLKQVGHDPRLPRRVGLQCDGRRVPREGYPIRQNAAQVGSVTSGTFSPTLEKPIAMGYVVPGAAEVGSQLVIDIRGREEPATVVPLPFYRRSG